MKCAMLVDTHQLLIQEVEKPIPKPGEVLIRVKLTGICGSEIHAFKGTHPYRVPPVILGHELVGEVVEITPGIKNLRVGERVTVEPQIPCKDCRYCRKGDVNLCQSKIVLGTKEWTGSFGEYVVAPESEVYKLPDTITDKQGVMVEPLAVGIHAVEKANVRIGETCLILGAGPIGLMTLLSAKASGATNIIITDTIDHNLKVAKELGATDVINVKTKNIIEEINMLTNGEGADAVFVTAGLNSVMLDALGCAAKTGRVILIALFEKSVDIEMFKIIGSELNIIGSIMYNKEDYKKAISLIEKRIVNVDPIITHVFSIDEVQKGMEMVDKKKDNALKVILVF